MAWPTLSFRLEAASGPSRLPSCSAHRPSLSTRHHRRRPKKTSSTSVPSAKLLFLLSTIASASTANASPAPPSFLCPSFGSKSVRGPCFSRRAEHPSPNSASGDPDHDQAQAQPDTIKLRWVPDKYEEGADGIWRRVESYTLYGATVPSNCDGKHCRPTHTMSSTGDSLKPFTGSKGTNITAPPIGIQLPPGWTPAPKPYQGRTTMILAISLALSLFICVLIIMCLFWRKSIIDKKKTLADVEAKYRRRGRREDLTSAELRHLEHEKEAKAMQKLWARATARWRANARYSLRQRRGKRIMRSLHVHQSSVPIDDSGSRLAGSRPLLLVQSREDELPSSRDRQSTSAGATQTPSRPSSPPAYQHGHGLPPIIISSPEYSAPCGLSTPSHLSLSRQLSQRSLYSSTTSPQQSSLERDLFPAVAHVATDDKVLLARLADMASAPAEGNDEALGPQVSAPEWHEELELETFVASTALANADIVSMSLLFPPPPSKERLAAAERLEYAFSFVGDLENVEPELEPSAPPFEEGSASPLDEPSLLPSAPPMISDEDHHRPSSSRPSAPAWEDSFPSPLPSQQENGQDHERTGT